MHYKSFWRCLMVCCVLAPVGAEGQNQAGQAPALLTNTAQKNYAIRFVYDRRINKDDVVRPITFEQVETEDWRFDTWSTEPILGLTMYLSPEQMKTLAGGLAELDLVWTQYRDPIVFHKEARQPPDRLLPFVRWKTIMARKAGTVEIDVTCDRGSAIADLRSGRVCTAMDELDSAFTTPTARNIFRSKRNEWGCRVPGFDPHETLPTSITDIEAAVLVNLVPIVVELRAKGSEISWETIDAKGLNRRVHWFLAVYNEPQAGGTSVPVGRFAVNRQTADVWDMNSGKIMHSPQLDAIQTVLRHEHRISESWIAYYAITRVEIT